MQEAGIGAGSTKWLANPSAADNFFHPRALRKRSHFASLDSLQSHPNMNDVQTLRPDIIDHIIRSSRVFSWWNEACELKVFKSIEFFLSLGTLKSLYYTSKGLGYIKNRYSLGFRETADLSVALSEFYREGDRWFVFDGGFLSLDDFNTSLSRSSKLPAVICSNLCGSHFLIASARHST
jgi:hypothetical protein